MLPDWGRDPDSEVVQVEVDEGFEDDDLQETLPLKHLELQHQLLLHDVAMMEEEEINRAESWILLFLMFNISTQSACQAWTVQSGECWLHAHFNEDCFVFSDFALIPWWNEEIIVAM